MVKIWKLGLVTFETAYKIQRAIARKHLNALASGQNFTHDVLLLLEHKPVYTIGIRDKTSQDEILKLKELGAEFRRTDRGGLITFHGPGQLIAYPIINLKRFKPSVKWYVDSLEETGIRLCAEFGLKASRSPHTGVWVGDNKIAAIGIHASRYITTHGLSLNCDTDLTWFDHIVPCGIEDKSVTSLKKETGSKVDVESVTPLFLKSFEEVFQCKTESIELELQEEILNDVYSNLMMLRV